MQGTVYQPGPAGELLVSGTPVVVEDTRTARVQYLLDAAAIGLRSYLAVPVLVGDELVGILACGESVARHYDRAAITLAQALAAQASAALRNAMQYEQTLEASRRDILTGLGNRRAFNESFDVEVERAMRYQRSLSLVILDVDNLKQVNDAGGHSAGDRVLERIAVLLEQTSRRQDGVFRIGGDEFAVVVPETAGDGANVAAERVRRAVERGRVGTDGEHTITVSVGLASLPTNAVNPDELFERADTAMYEVKKSGGNAVATASQRDEQPGTRFGVNVRAVIDENRLVPLYQPIVHLIAGVVLGYEGMTRIGPAFGSTPTTTLFRAAGALGLTELLDASCRRVVLAGARGLNSDHFLFVNVAPAALESEDFDLDELLDSIARVELDPEQIVLEVTEQGRTLAPRLVQNLERCRKAGLGVSLDDFSSARTDAELASSVRFDYLKVDTGLIAGDSREARRTVLRSLLEIARDIGAMPIAEGVETLDDLELVRELGFDAAQGFFISDPASMMREPKHIDLLTSN
jgi:diguanylate cyclase (GGDEF)-like protein